MKSEIAVNIEKVEERINNACIRSGRKRGDISLLAVTKLHPIEKAEEAWKNGLRLFGESRVQEGVEKFNTFRSGHERDKNDLSYLHLIGTLQRNKAKIASSFFDCIQSVDRVTLIDELGGLTADRQTPLLILLEYHTGEKSKAGFPSLDELYRGAEKALSWPGLRLAGLMTMAPLTSDENLIRSSFRSLVKAQTELEKKFREASWACLSMGMSGDFEIAIEEGSTMLRLGSAIFS